MAGGAGQAGHRSRPGIRHCWIRQGDRAVEALLVSWLDTPAGWQAEVVFVDPVSSAVAAATVDAADIRAAREA